MNGDAIYPEKLCKEIQELRDLMIMKGLDPRNVRLNKRQIKALEEYHLLPYGVNTKFFDLAIYPDNEISSDSFVIEGNVIIDPEFFNYKSLGKYEKQCQLRLVSIEQI